MPHVCRMGYLLAFFIGAALLAAQVWHPVPPARFAGLQSADIPRTVGGYAAGPDDAVPADVQAALASANLTSRTYRPSRTYQAGQGEDAVNFVLIGGTDRSALHDPRSCLIGAGMAVQDDRLERLPGTEIDARACRAINGTAGGGTASDRAAQSGFDIIYLYLVNGRVVNEATQIRAAMLWSALLGQRGTPVYFLRFTRPLHSDPRLDAQGHAALLQFAADMWTKLQPRLLPSPARSSKGQIRVYQNICRQYPFS